jgi:chondroitin AC lyase
VIAVPRSVSEAYILLLNTSVLGPAELVGGDTLLARADWTQQTGENAVWCLRTGGINRGVLNRNSSLVSAAFATAWSQLRVQPLATSAHCLSPACANVDCCDGLQLDFSFHQHGPLLQSAAYGQGFMEDLLSFVALAAQTRWEIPQAPLSLLADFLLLGQRYMMRAGEGTLNATWHIPPLDREIGRPPGGPTVLDASVLAQQVETSLLRSALSQGRLAALRQWISELRGRAEASRVTRHFENSDYTVHQRARFTIDLRMYSRRTFNAECDNYENQKGWHLSEGASYVYRDGHEYWNGTSGTGIFPVWDWERVPGTLARHGAGLRPCQFEHRGPTSFVGAVCFISILFVGQADLNGAGCLCTGCASGRSVRATRHSDERYGAAGCNGWLWIRSSRLCGQHKRTVSRNKLFSVWEYVHA